MYTIMSYLRVDCAMGARSTLAVFSLYTWNVVDFA